MRQPSEGRRGKGAGVAWVAMAAAVLVPLLLLALLIVHAQTAKRPRSLVLGRWVLGVRPWHMGKQPARGPRITGKGQIHAQVGGRRIVGSRMEAGSYLWFTWMHFPK